MIIKCPECGRQVSDKAPTCPSCGVEIAGKIKRCEQCGEAVFTNDEECPYCHAILSTKTENHTDNRRAGNGSTGAFQQYDVKQTATAAENETPAQDGNPHSPKKTSRKRLIAAVLFSVCFVGMLLYIYNQSQQNHEETDYNYAMSSAEPEILKDYLLRYPDAPQAHRDSITAHLESLEKGNEAWENAARSNSRSELMRYIEENPSSLHVQEAMLKIDSIDWAVAQKGCTEDAVRKYLADHPDGRYYDEATIMLGELEKSQVQPEEETMVIGLFSQFFEGLNMHDEETLVSTVSMVLNNFLGKTNATANDVVTFLNKIYKGDIDNMNWVADRQTYKINKVTNEDGEQEYHVIFYANERIQREGATENLRYRITATVTAEGRISGFEMTKINE